MQTLLQGIHYGLPAGKQGTFLWLVSLLTVIALAACASVALRMISRTSEHKPLRPVGSIGRREAD
jgi:hypothetical protein